MPIQSVVTGAEGRRVCFKMNAKGERKPVPVETGYYDQTHIQITKGLMEGDTVLKAPLLHAKELNVGGDFFGYRKMSPDDLGVDLPETKGPAKPAPTAAKSGDSTTSAPTKVANTGKGSGGSRKGGSGRSSGPPAELNLTDDQKAKWTAASNKMQQDMRGLFTSGIAREQMAAKMSELRDTFNAELKTILTKEQLGQYEQSGRQGAQKGKGTGGGRGSRGGSLMDLDIDGDGKVTEEEYSKLDERARQFMGEFSTQDTDGDGGITKEEADAARQRMMQRFRQLQGSGGSGGGGE